MKSDSASSITSPVSSKSSGKVTSMPTSNEPASSGDDQGNCRAILTAGDSNSASTSDSSNRIAPASLSGATSSKKAKGKEKEKEKDKRKKEAAAAAKREAAEAAQRAAAAEGRRVQVLGARTCNNRLASSFGSPLLVRSCLIMVQFFGYRALCAPPFFFAFHPTSKSLALLRPSRGHFGRR